MPDGRDFDSVFTFGDGGQTTGFQVVDGTDIGHRYIAGNSGLVTGMQNHEVLDLGGVLGTYVSMALTIDEIWTLSEGGTEVTVEFHFSGGIGPYTAVFNATIGAETDTATGAVNVGQAHSMTALLGSSAVGGIHWSLTVRDSTGASVTQSGVIE